MIRRTFLLAGAALAMTAAVSPARARDQWTKAQANSWHAKQPWQVGANYTPATAINQLEMFQAETWDPQRIDLELGWAAAMGMNVMRVNLHHLLWETDAAGLKRRMDEFMTIAAKHKIKTLWIFFDSCWDPNPVAGPQHPPIPGVHNSGSVQSPGADRLKDASQYGKLEAYVKDLVTTFAKDDRVIGWDIWNEPNNGGGGHYTPTKDKNKYVALLLPRFFAAARAADPVQPLTSGVWIGEHWDDQTKLDAVEKIQIRESDILSFHDYSWAEKFEVRAKQMLSYGRPVWCTEYMARGNGSTFDNTLPIAKKLNIAMYNWGFVDGKMQTRFPWDSWKKPYTYEEPTIWFHDILHFDGKPYRQAEVDLIKRLAAAPKGVVPASGK
ncbi:cellulase family glycosylhydrolase [Sphingomonas sp. HF-S4]|uniref:Cellulase family glycosylhydrolase n=1 Tax=Sphingomonas agrestis TaxID=3080540 RepID=A0ABU3YDV7_9SPHN|nr:cellulase family glycosylhydrolase [Sphingomonas sp. HF-S4]MDV3459383.1 cellulase family glycosylhydrolase [Sphingomonas sp. HF-S4]